MSISSRMLHDVVKMSLWLIRSSQALKDFNNTDAKLTMFYFVLFLLFFSFSCLSSFLFIFSRARLSVTFSSRKKKKASTEGRHAHWQFGENCTKTAQRHEPGRVLVEAASFGNNNCGALEKWWGQASLSNIEDD